MNNALSAVEEYFSLFVTLSAGEGHFSLFTFHYSLYMAQCATMLKLGFRYIQLPLR